MKLVQNVRVNPIIAIVCDEIRHEQDGKPFIIGIYNDGLKITAQGFGKKRDQEKAKFLWSFYIWMPIAVLESGIAVMEMRISMGGQDAIIEAELSMQVKMPATPTQVVPVTIGPLSFPVSQSGNIHIEFRNKGDEAWQILRVIPVEFNITEAE